MKPARQRGIGKRGVSLGPFTLVETIIAMLVFVVVGLSIVGIAGNASFFQSFFAKDNAMMLETLQAVPNGEVRFAYLWVDPGFEIHFSPGEVDVKLTEQRSKWLAVRANARKKAFGASDGVTTTDIRFPPSSYEFVYAPTTPRSITIEETFVSSGCPTSLTTLEGLAMDGTTDGFDQAIATRALSEARSGIETAFGARQQHFSTDGLKLRLHVIRGPPAAPGVYAIDGNTAAARLGCLLATTVGGGATVRSMAAAPPAALQAGAQQSPDLLLIVTATDEANLPLLSDIIRRSVVGYSVATPSGAATGGAQ